MLGYKGLTQLSLNEVQECSSLEEIISNIGCDILGDYLYKRYMFLALDRGDMGMFYCPYIPLITVGTIYNTL